MDHPDQVVRDEPAAVSGLSGMVAQVVLQRRERAGEADELGQSAVYHCRDVRPGDPRPAPGKKDSAHNEADEQQVDDNHQVSGNPVPHRVSAGTTCQSEDRRTAKIGSRPVTCSSAATGSHRRCWPPRPLRPGPQKIAVGSRWISRRRSSMCGDGASRSWTRKRRLRSRQYTGQRRVAWCAGAGRWGAWSTPGRCPRARAACVQRSSDAGARDRARHGPGGGHDRGHAGRTSAPLAPPPAQGVPHPSRHESVKGRHSAWSAAAAHRAAAIRAVRRNAAATADFLDLLLVSSGKPGQVGRHIHAGPGVTMGSIRRVGGRGEARRP